MLQTSEFVLLDPVSGLELTDRVAESPDIMQQCQVIQGNAFNFFVWFLIIELAVAL